EIGIGPRDDARELWIAPERGHIVDEHRAAFESFPGHGCLRRVNREWEPVEPVEDGHVTPQLLVGRDAFGAGPRRLAPDVDDRRPLLDHATRRRSRRVGVEVDAAVGERVRRHVQDAHDRRSREALLDRLNHSWILALSGLWTYHPNVFRKGRNRDVPVSLPNERKALAERYTIDAEEAEARSQRAAEDQGTGQTEGQVARLGATELQARHQADVQQTAP